MEGALLELFRVGGSAALMAGALVIVVRALKDQYENRIDTLERRSNECDLDRKKLWQDREELQKQIADIWRKLAERKNDA